MIEYNICNQADEAIFNKQCIALEKNIPGIIKKELIIDVDNSKTQEYALGGNKILVVNSNYMNEVYVNSEVKLEQYFNSK